MEKTGKTYKECSRDFLLKWSFFSIKIVRELTLHSAHSFGKIQYIINLVTPVESTTAKKLLYLFLIKTI